MANICLAGAETGDLNEIVSTAAAPTIATWPGVGGNYCYKMEGNPTVNLYANAGFLLSPTVQGIGVSFRWRCDSLSGGVDIANIMAVRETSVTTSPALALTHHINNRFRIIGLGGITFTSETYLGFFVEANTDYVIHFVLEAAAGGIFKVWVDKNGEGPIQIFDTTHPTAMAQFTRLYGDGPREVGHYNYLDDIYVIDTATKPNTNFNSRIIARHARAGTPNVNAFTKTASATIDNIWNDTPTDGGTTEAHSTAASQAQTALVENFSITQTGHGTEIIGANDTLHTAKVNGYLRERDSGTTRIYSLRRRVSGANTDEAKVLTASAALYEMSLFTPASLSELYGMEFGAVRGASTGKNVQMDDGWVHVLYTPVGLPEKPRIYRQAVNRASTY